MTPLEAGPPADLGQLPYRPNVGAVLFNRHGAVFVGRRADLPPDEADISGWQFPQGGIDGDEDPRRAVLRELREEIGTDCVQVIGEHPEWLTYDFPPAVRPGGAKAAHRGQRQRWFALRFLGEDADVNLHTDRHPEFNAWRWVTLDSVPSTVVAWKRPVYDKLVGYFLRYANPQS